MLLIEVVKFDLFLRVAILQFYASAIRGLFMFIRPAEHSCNLR